jgi:outer membrane protein TolC
MGETETRIAVENFIAELASEYYNFIQQRRRLDNYRNAVKLSKERLRIVEERYNIGSFSRLDYQQAKVDFNADSAQYLKQQEIVITSRIALNELMAIKQVYTPIETKEKDIDIDSTLNFERLWYDTFDKNASLLLAEQNKTISNFDYKKAMSRFYPSLKLNAGYDYAFNHYSNSNYTLRQGWGGNVGITLGFKIWNGNEKREKRNAKIKIQNAELQRDQIELAVKAELGNIWHAYQNNLQLARLEKHNVITARENHDIAKERYMLGDLSGIEMREAQQSLLEAEERLLSVEFNAKICEISLMLISGNISRYLE